MPDIMPGIGFISEIISYNNKRQNVINTIPMYVAAI
jgi:hypothetical protein